MPSTGVVPAHHPNAVSPGYLLCDIVAGILTLVATVCVSLRSVHRLRATDFAWDDGAILISLVFSIGALIGTFLASAPSIAAAGYHITAYTVPELNTYSKLALAVEVLYNCSVAGSKASILLFYNRIFSVDRQFLLFMRFMILLILSNCLVCVIGLIFSTNPVQAQWTVGIPHTSINGPVFWTVMAVVNILIDIMILGIALLAVWKLRMSMHRKLMISLVFLLGAFTIVTSILRIIYLLLVDEDDITYSMTTAGLWTNVEMNLSIICACAPIMYNFFHRKKMDGRTTNQSSGCTSNYNNNSKKSGVLVAIGSGPAKFNSNGSRFQDSTYRTIVEADGETQSMEALAPIQSKQHIRSNTLLC